MNGKQLVLDTLDHKKRSGFRGFPLPGPCRILMRIQCYGNFKGCGQIVQSGFGSKPYLQCRRSAVLFDLQVEAEILGCELQWEPYSPPSVRTHPLENTDRIPCLCRLPKNRRQNTHDIGRDETLEERNRGSYRFVRLNMRPFTLLSFARQQHIHGHVRRRGIR